MHAQSGRLSWHPAIALRGLATLHMGVASIGRCATKSHDGVEALHAATPAALQSEPPLAALFQEEMGQACHAQVHVKPDAKAEEPPRLLPSLCWSRLTV